MSKRYDIMTPRKGNEKTFWTRIGTAWQNDKGGIQLVFDALPIPDSEGRVVANLFEPRENNQRDGHRKPNGSQGHAGGFADDLGGDEVPF